MAHQIAMICPNESDKEIAHRVAEQGRPEKAQRHKAGGGGRAQIEHQQSNENSEHTVGDCDHTWWWLAIQWRSSVGSSNFHRGALNKKRLVARAHSSHVRCADTRSSRRFKDERDQQILWELALETRPRSLAMLSRRLRSLPANVGLGEIES